MCMIDSGEGFAASRRSTPRARKPHACGECGRLISIGEQYERHHGLYEGTWYSAATCRHCVAAREWLYRVCGGALFHGVQEDLEEHWEEGAPYRSFWLGRVIVEMRRKWRNGASRVPGEPPAVFDA